MADAVLRPPDDQYWIPNWSTVLFAGDLFAAIPFAEQPFEAFVDPAGHGKHFVGPVAYAYGLLISPTCDMVDQKTFEAGAVARRRPSICTLVSPSLAFRLAALVTTVSLGRSCHGQRRTRLTALQSG